MAKSKRIFEIARELGVQSKAILDKCRAEGLEVNNHMTAVSIGLAATIRDWFSAQHDDGGGTAVETAAAVDLSKVKARPRRRKAIQPEDAGEETKDEGVKTEETPVVEEAGVEAPAEVDALGDQAPAPAKAKAKARPKAKPKAKPDVETAIDGEAVADEVKDSGPAVEGPGKGTAIVDDATDEDSEGGEPGAKKKEEKSEEVKPAGPQMNAPAKAVMKGPKVVRIEAPEEIRQPRQRRGPRAEPDNAPGEIPDIIRSTGPARGKGVGGKGAGGGMGEGDKAGAKKRKGQSTRRKSRGGEAAAWYKGARGEQDLIEREARLSHAAGFMKKRRMQMKARGVGVQSEMPVQTGGKVEISEPFTIKDLSSATGIKGADIVKYLFTKGIMTTINHAIDPEVAMEVCMEYEIELEVKEEQTAEQQVVSELETRDRTDVRPRPPVVAVLGHVDHGKTSLLDRIRRADVAAGEAGGITQHIGAFRTTITSESGDKTVVFLDTPGHQAFTNMRARGATLADVVVVVVAADDGVMPQTIESINHARESGVPIVVALNKTDLPQATDTNIQRILGQLAEQELNPVEWGGSTEVVRVSAETGDGITDLIEVLDYQAELLELTADYSGSAHGQVIEAELDPGRGPIARVLVREGQLSVGDAVVVGRSFGKVRSIMDDHGQNLDTAGPATPVEVSGINEVPDAGDKMYVTELKKAEQIAVQFRNQERKHELAVKSKVTLDNVFEKMKTGDSKELPIVLKADVHGSLEVLRTALEELSTDEVRVRVVHSAVGGITETDVDLAAASTGVVIGFQVIAGAAARAKAEQQGVDMRLYRVIYDITDDVRKALEGLLDPELREEVLGHAEVREVFRVSKVGAVAGCYVTDGVVRRNALIRVTRSGIVVEHDRTLEQLKRFKDDVKEVRSGMECGMKINGYDDIHEGDVLECYVTQEFRPTLS